MSGLRFQRGAKGKPFPQGTKLQFNLSHTEGLVACSLAWRPVGIDVENGAARKRDRTDWKAVARRAFNPRERDFIHSLPVKSRSAGFFKLFALKEAYLKALGTGLGRSLRELPVPLPLRERIRLKGWEFFIPPLPRKNFYAAHAVKRAGAPLRVHCRHWDEADFLEDLRRLKESAGSQRAAPFSAGTL